MLCNESYRNELVAEFVKQNFEGNSLEKFLDFYNKVLDKDALRKSKFVRGKRYPFMNRELSKAIMTRARLRNKEKTGGNRRNCNKQRNYRVTLLRKTKKEYYYSLDGKHVTDKNYKRKCGDFY